MIKLSEMVRIRVADHFYYFFRDVFEKSGKNTILNWKAPIKLNDLDFKGYVRLQCHAKCSIDYHTLCWKHKKDHDVIAKDKNILLHKCSTPDCGVPIVKVTIIKENLEELEIKDDELTKRKLAEAKAKSKGNP